MTRKTTLSIMCFVLFCTMAGQAAYQVGDHVNNFTLMDSQGNPHSLYEYEGTVVLLNFWQDT